MKLLVKYIYGLQDPNTLEIRYIGASVNPKARLSDHWTKRENNTLKEDWIESLQIKPILVILDELSEDWESREAYWIQHALNLGWNLVNVFTGTTRQRRFPRSQDFCSRQSKSRQGKSTGIPSESTRQKLSIAMQGRILTDEHKRKISESYLRRKGL